MYQQFLDHTVEDFCGILAGSKNVFMDRFFLDPIRLSAPDLIHPCPYVILDINWYFGVKNFTMNIKETNDDSLLPSTFFLTNKLICFLNYFFPGCDSKDIFLTSGWSLCRWSHVYFFFKHWHWVSYLIGIKVFIVES